MYDIQEDHNVLGKMAEEHCIQLFRFLLSVSIYNVCAFIYTYTFMIEKEFQSKNNIFPEHTVME